MVSEKLHTGDFNTLRIYIYDQDNYDEWKFYGAFVPENIQYDGDFIYATVLGENSRMEIVLPVPPDNEINYYDESDSYDYVINGNRYELYF